jgi:hypothetical protein
MANPQKKSGNTRKKVLRAEAIERRVKKAKARVKKGLAITPKQLRLIREHG